MRTIDLSCDLGEAADQHQQAVEDAIWPLITSANIACGGHAGDQQTMQHARRQAQRYGVRLGAHPSYPDRANFGRRTMRLPAGELKRSLVEQIRSLAATTGQGITHVKPHGALYNDAHHDMDLAQVVVEALGELGAPVAMVASADSALFRAAVDAGVPAIAEAFGDRRYQGDGSLVPRSRPDALLLDLDEAADQALLLAEARSVRAEDGQTIRIDFDTICVHGDMNRSVERLESIRSQLAAAGFTFAAAAPRSANRGK